MFKALERTKQQMVKLLDRDFVKGLFNERLFEYYADFKEVEELELRPYKKHVGSGSVVFVVEYKIKYSTTDKKLKKLAIFATSHSDGSKKNAYAKAKFLYEHGFNQKPYLISRPLFFVSEQRAYFYEASLGRSLFHLFSHDPQADLRPAFILATGWLKKLHSLKVTEKIPGISNFSVLTMIPSPNRFIKDFMKTNPQQGRLVEEIFQGILQLEKKYQSQFVRVLVHGDYHPDNLIIKDLQAKEVNLIDFVDLAWGDPMLDLGVFLQQFDFMGHSFVPRPTINEHKNFFISSYFDQPLATIDPQYLQRLNFYQSWTALRSAIFLFYMNDPANPIDDLLRDAHNYWKLSQEGRLEINLY